MRQVIYVEFDEDTECISRFLPTQNYASEAIFNYIEHSNNTMH